MNTRRQTVWLVSMLGLMVVLSAYYLFTDDVDNLQTASETSVADEAIIESTELADDWFESGVWEEVKSDEQIIEEYDQARETMGYDYFTALQLQRFEKINEEIETWMAIANDAASSDEAVAQAYEEINRLEEMDQKITHLEEVLMRNFENVILTEEGERWNVLVKADQLDKSQAVAIIDLVSEELQVHAGDIQVQVHR